MGDVSELPHGELDARSMPRFLTLFDFHNVFQSALHILIHPLYVRDELNFTEEETEPIEINKVNF